LFPPGDWLHVPTRVAGGLAGAVVSTSFKEPNRPPRLSILSVYLPYSLTSLEVTVAEMDQRQEAFPAPSKHATGLVNGVETEVSSTSFSDKIMVTISQDGRLPQWVRKTAFVGDVITC
jgi:hypothetical protein